MNYFKLVYKSGYVRTSDYSTTECNSHWGKCTETVSLAITRENNSIIVPDKNDPRIMVISSSGN